MKTIGEKLFFLRESRHIKQKDVAQALGITPQAYSQYERNLRRPDVERIRELSAFFGVSADFIVGAPGEETATLSLESDLESLVAQLGQLFMTRQDFTIGGQAAGPDDMQYLSDGLSIALEMVKRRHGIRKR